jgi:hypothetical protein
MLPSWIRKLLRWFRRAPVSTVVTFDAQGAGTSVSAKSSVSTAWNHTVSRDCTLVVGLRWIQTGGSGGAPTRSVAWNKKSMDPLGIQALDNVEVTAANGIYLEFFGLGSPPDGPGTISVTAARPGATDITVEGCSVSYAGASAWGPRSGMVDKTDNIAMRHDVSSSPNEMVVHMFTTASGPIHNPNQTVRHVGVGFVVGDAPGANKVSFTAA